MTKVIRFFHVRATFGNGAVTPKGGATVMVEGDMTNSEETLVFVRHTLCSHNDPFSRKMGREQAKKNYGRFIPLKGLPGYLHKLTKKVLKQVPVRDLGVHVRAEHKLFDQDWSFSKRYWLEREKPAAELGVIATQVQDAASEHGMLMH